MGVSPDYYPTGEQIFQTGAAWNWASCSDADERRQYRRQYQYAGLSDRVQNYLAEQLPVIYQPNYVTNCRKLKRV